MRQGFVAKEVVFAAAVTCPWVATVGDLLINENIQTALLARDLPRGSQHWQCLYIEDAGVDAEEELTCRQCVRRMAKNIVSLE